MTTRQLTDVGGIAWRERAACLEVAGSTPLFFTTRQAEADAAKALCSGCLVRKQCLTYALSNHIDHGIWGGESERSRRRILRRQKRAKAKARKAA